MTLLIGLVVSALICITDAGALQGTCRCILLPLPVSSPAINSLANNLSHVNLIDDGGSPVELIPVDSRVQYATLVEYAEELLSQVSGPSADRICQDVVGVVGDIDARTAGVILSLSRMFGQNISLVASVVPSSFLPIFNTTLPNVFHLKPPSHYIEGIVSLIRYWNWTRIGVIADDTIFYQSAAEMLLGSTAFNGTALPYIRTNNKGDFARVLSEIQEYRTHIFVVLMREPLTCSLFKQLNRSGLTWPEYAWIVLDLGYECSFKLEGVIALQEGEDNFTNPLCSLYGNEMKDLCNALVLVAGHNDYIKLKDGKRIFNVTVQFFNGSGQEIANYNPDTQQLSVFNNITTGTRPQGNIEVVTFTLPLKFTILNPVITSLCFLYITAVFVLYLYFYKEPEIRATSVSVSLCMFTGCYLLLILNILLLVKVTTFVCNLQTWLSGIGISNLLIFATLFMKMFRVYIIFLKPLSFKKKLLSNPALFIFILLILLPQALILLLWAAVDTFKSVQLEFILDHRLMVTERCSSNHTLVWLLLLLIYILFVMIILIVLAFKSSKIRYENFQDTKATNAFTFLAIFITITTLIFWLFFRNLGVEKTFTSFVKASYTLCISHTLLAFLCPTFLFLPKVYPPSKRHFFKSKVLSKRMPSLLRFK